MNVYAKLAPKWKSLSPLNKDIHCERLTRDFLVEERTAHEAESNPNTVPGAVPELSPNVSFFETFSAPTKVPEISPINHLKSDNNILSDFHTKN